MPRLLPQYAKPPGSNEPKPMWKKKIKPGDFIRQQSTGNILQVAFGRHDVWVCQQEQPGAQQQVVSINDAVRLSGTAKTPKKP